MVQFNWQSAFFALIVALYFGELVTKQYELPQPSEYISLAANVIVDGFYYFGNAFADVFSYLQDLFELIHLRIFVDTFLDLFRPIFRLFISPLYFFEGYYDGLVTYAYPLLIAVSSFLFISAAVVLCEFFMKRYNENYKPSKAILFYAYVSGLVYKFIGKNVAYMSSFYHVLIDLLTLHELFDAAYDVVKACVRVLLTPLKAVTEYVNTIKTYRAPTLIGYGTITVVGAFAYYAYTYTTNH